MANGKRQTLSFWSFVWQILNEHVINNPSVSLISNFLTISLTLSLVSYFQKVKLFRFTDNFYHHCLRWSTTKLYWLVIMLATHPSIQLHIHQFCVYYVWHRPEFLGLFWFLLLWLMLLRISSSSFSILVAAHLFFFFLSSIFWLSFGLHNNFFFSHWFWLPFWLLFHSRNEESRLKTATNWLNN